MAAMFEIVVMSENLGFNNVSRKRVRYSLHSHVMAKFVSEGICSIQVPYVSTMGAFSLMWICMPLRFYRRRKQNELCMVLEILYVSKLRFWVKDPDQILDDDI